MRHTSPAPGSGNEAPHCRSIQEQRTPTMRLTCTRFPKSDRPARQPRGLVLEAQDLQGSARARSLRSFSLLRQGMPPHRGARTSHDPSRFTYARLYCGPDGDTHFQDVTAELRKMNFAPPAPPIDIGSDFPASRAFFGGFDANWGVHDLENHLNHPTPALQFGIVLQGIFSITTTDGETRTPASRQRVPVGGHLTLQGTHHRRGRPDWILHVRSLNGAGRHPASV